MSFFAIPLENSLIWLHPKCMFQKQYQMEVWQWGACIHLLDTEVGRLLQHSCSDWHMTWFDLLQKWDGHWSIERSLASGGVIPRRGQKQSWDIAPKSAAIHWRSWGDLQNDWSKNLRSCHLSWPFSLWITINQPYADVDHNPILSRRSVSCMTSRITEFVVKCLR